MTTPLLSAREVAAELGLNEQTVRKMTRQRLLPAINVGFGRTPRWRYQRSDIDAFLRSRRQA